MAIWDDIAKAWTGTGSFLEACANLIGELAKTLPAMAIDVEKILKLFLDLLTIIIEQLIVLATFFKTEPELSILSLFSIFIIVVIVIKHA